MNKSLALIPLLAAPLFGQVTQQFNPVQPLGSELPGRDYQANGYSFGNTANTWPTDAGWVIHGYLRQNLYFNAANPAYTNQPGNDDGLGGNASGLVSTDNVSLTRNQAAWIQGQPQGYNQRGWDLGGQGTMLNPQNVAFGSTPNVGSNATPTYRVPANFDSPGQANPSERQSGALSPNLGTDGSAGYLSAFGRSVGATGAAGANNYYLNRDVNRTLFWTPNSPGGYVFGAQFDVINQNSNSSVPDRATLAVRVNDGMGDKWYVAAYLDSATQLYIDPTLPYFGDAASADLNNATAIGNARTLVFDFRQVDNVTVDNRYVWYELTFDGDWDGIDETTVTNPTDLNIDNGGTGQFSLELPAAFGTEGPTSLTPVYTQFPDGTITAWGVFMRYASGNRRIDNFFVLGAPGGGSHGQNADHGNNQRQVRAQQTWAQHVRTQQVRAAQRHRLNQQR